MFPEINNGKIPDYPHSFLDKDTILSMSLDNNLTKSDGGTFWAKYANVMNINKECTRIHVKD